MICRAWRYIRTEPGFYFAMFLVVWLSAWTANGLAKTAFDLDRLRDLAVFVLGKYLTDSGLNTQFGSKVQKGDCVNENRNPIGKI